jgi:Cu+-exporting ATPase
MESADIVLMNNSLASVSSAIELSKATMRNIRQNLFWAFFYNTLGIPVAAGALVIPFGISLSPMLGAAAMSMSSVFVVTNALRLRFFRSKQMPTVVSSCEEGCPVAAEEYVEEVSMEEKPTTVIGVGGMMCPHCTAAVEKACLGVPGVESAVASLEHKNVTIIGEADIEVIKKAIRDEDYEILEGS